MVGRSLRPCLQRRRLAEACVLACCTGLASVSAHAAGRALSAPGADIAAEASLPAPTPLTAPQALYLDTTLNQARRGLLLFHELAGRLQAPAATLRQLGFPVQGDAPVYLSGHNTVWGATTGTNTVAGTGTGANQVYQVYGQVANPSVNNAAPGSYQDTITATITY